MKEFILSISVCAFALCADTYYKADFIIKIDIKPFYKIDNKISKDMLCE